MIATTTIATAQRRAAPATTAVYLLLLPLCAWQAVIAVGTLRMRPKR